MGRLPESRLDALRSQPLEPLAQALGYRRHRRDRRKWIADGSIISIEGGKFYDHAAGKGGGGAFDLVIHARNCGFGEALEFLAATAPAEPPPAAAAAQARSFRPPEPCDAAWPGLRDRIAARRAISPRLLDAARERGIACADGSNNAVFLCTDARRRPKGAEIVGFRADGTAFRGMAKGSRKAEGSFWIPVGAPPVRTVFLAESAIDILSARMMPKLCEPGTALLSTAGVAPRLPAWIDRQWDLNRILCGYDADRAGDDGARRLAETDPRVVRVRPRGAKDWNDILKAALRRRKG